MVPIDVGRDLAWSFFILFQVFFTGFRSGELPGQSKTSMLRLFRNVLTARDLCVGVPSCIKKSQMGECVPSKLRYNLLIAWQCSLAGQGSREPSLPLSPLKQPQTMLLSGCLTSLTMQRESYLLTLRGSTPFEDMIFYLWTNSKRNLHIICKMERVWSLSLR